MNIKPAGEKATRYRWTVCMMLFFATTVNYMDRQVLSLTWMDFIAPEFHWTNVHYGKITGIFSIMYAIGVLFAGRIIDRIDTKKGYLWAIGIWSIGACLHALCGVITEAVVGLDSAGALRMAQGVDMVARITTVSVSLFIFARSILALGEAGNFPAAVKATAEYFPKKDRGFATSIFNAGATVGALVAPVTVPLIATRWGWEAAFLIIGALGFIWMGFWIFIYKKPEVHPKVNRAELLYIQQDGEDVSADDKLPVSQTRISFWKCLTFRQTWAFALGKFMTDGVWWFFLFWTPAYLSSVYDLPSNNPTAQLLIFVLYAITLLAIIGGWLPTYFVDKKDGSLCRKNAGHADICLFPVTDHVGPAAGKHILLDTGHYYWHCRSGASGMVSQPVFNHRGYVPEKYHSHHNGYRNYGRDDIFLCDQSFFGCFI